MDRVRSFHSSRSLVAMAGSMDSGTGLIQQYSLDVGPIPEESLTAAKVETEIEMQSSTANAATETQSSTAAGMKRDDTETEYIINKFNLEQVSALLEKAPPGIADEKLVVTISSHHDKRIPLSQSAIRAADVVNVDIVDRAICQDLQQLSKSSGSWSMGQLARIIVARVLESARNKVMREDKLPPATTWTEKARREAILLVEDVVSSAMIYIGRGGDADAASAASVSRTLSRRTDDNVADDVASHELSFSEQRLQPPDPQQDDTTTLMPSLTEQVSIIIQPSQQQSTVLPDIMDEKETYGTWTADHSLTQQISIIETPSSPLQQQHVDVQEDEPALETQTSDVAPFTAGVSPLEHSSVRVLRSNFQSAIDADKPPATADKSTPETTAEKVAVGHTVGEQSANDVHRATFWPDIFLRRSSVLPAASNFKTDSESTVHGDNNDEGSHRRYSWRPAFGSGQAVHEHPSTSNTKVDNDRSPLSALNEESNSGNPDQRHVSIDLHNYPEDPDDT